MREYALERLAERADADGVGLRHAAFFLTVAETAEAALRTAEHAAWLRRLDAERGNLRTAFHTLLARENSASALRLAVALSRWWLWRDPAEGRRWLAAALERHPTAAPLRAQALVALGRMAKLQGDHADAVAALRESAALARQLGNGDVAVLAQSLLASVLADMGNHAEAESLTARCQRELDALVDPWVRADALAYLGCGFVGLGQLPRAVTPLQQSLALHRRLGAVMDICGPLNDLGYTFLGLGRYEQAREHLDEALDLARHHRNGFVIAVVLGNLGLVVLFEERYHDSIRRLTEAAWQCHQQSAPAFLAEALLGLAAAHAGCGQFEHAARLAGAADTLDHALGIPAPPFVRAEVDRHLARTRQELGDARFATLMDEGSAMTPEAAARYAQDAAAETLPAARAEGGTDTVLAPPWEQP